MKRRVALAVVSVGLSASSAASAEPPRHTAATPLEVDCTNPYRARGPAVAPAPAISKTNPYREATRVPITIDPRNPYTGEGWI